MGGTQYVALGHSYSHFRRVPSIEIVQVPSRCSNTMHSIVLLNFDCATDFFFFFWLLKYYAIVFSLLMLLSVLSLKLIGILIFSHLLLSAL